MMINILLIDGEMNILKNDYLCSSKTPNTDM